jgi:predicted lipid-binding transport protein (Tim44 family)
MQPNWLSTRAQQKVVNSGAAIISGLVFGLVGGLVGGLGLGLGLGLVGGLGVGLVEGGLACLQHLSLRFLLWRNDFAPWHYVRFLDYAAERGFLRKVGGGYIFVHRLLLEYFAMLEPQVDGQQIAKAG